MSHLNLMKDHKELRVFQMEALIEKFSKLLLKCMPSNLIELFLFVIKISQWMNS